MSRSCGLVGLPNAGKSTLFNALTRGGAEEGIYPFTTIGCHRGTLTVPDPRVDRLRELAGSRIATPAGIEVVDIAGLVRGASRGEGLGNQFLAHIREADAVIHVLRCFEAPAVSHPEGELDPLRDLQIVLTELCLADLESVRRRRERVARQAKSGERALREELALLDRAEEILDRGQPIAAALTAAEREYLFRRLFLLTARPCVYLANLDERAAADPSCRPWWEPLGARAAADRVELVPYCARLEADLALLDQAAREEFARELGASGPEPLVGAILRALGLVTFLTCNASETRAWLVPAGTTALEAAGSVHSDMQEGFIRAEVTPFDALLAAGSPAAARESGLTRIEGRDYPVAEGDVILFRFRPPG